MELFEDHKTFPHTDLMKTTISLTSRRSFFKLVTVFFLVALPRLPSAQTTPASAGSPTVVFIGNSFTFGSRSAVQFYRADSVTDLNGDGRGGVPALFKAFALQAGLNFEVFHELIPGSGLDRHLAEKAAILSRPWDHVIMHGYSTLDRDKPGDPGLLLWSTAKMAELLHAQNPAVDIRIEATWSRADETYVPTGHWYGKNIDTMAKDVRAGYDLAAANCPLIRGVVPVGEAWNRAMAGGVADPNPYDGIGPEQVNLWTHDHYHGSTHGYYLAALVVFGEITGLDPRSLGEKERCAFELGISPSHVTALQQVAFEELVANTPTPKLKTFEPVALPR